MSVVLELAPVLVARCIDCGEPADWSEDMDGEQPRCVRCYDALLEREDAEWAALAVAPEGHGTQKAYQGGCRCQDCRLAHLLYQRRYERRRRDRERAVKLQQQWAGERHGAGMGGQASASPRVRGRPALAGVARGDAGTGGRA